jgi:nucleoside-diphosphate-sugar epimerase
MVDSILKAAGKAPVKGNISKRTAWTIGAFLEFTYKCLRLSGEPRMTRFLAEELSTSHWFSIEAARKDLGYTPAVSIAQGLMQLENWFIENRAAQ